eukprot:scaffold1868_cov193-Cylindrotheca_fusiformis.AAC.15
MLTELADRIDSLIGVRGSLGYILIAIVAILGHNWLNPPPVRLSELSAEKDEDETEPPRNFTQKQLAQFDGKDDEKTGEPKPVYLSVGGIVFDVSDGKNFYGPGGPYEAFAGHECGVALAKMSFDTEHLDDLAGCDKLNFGEKTELEGWIEKFQYYRNYPIKGRLVPDEELRTLKERIIHPKDLSKHKGEKDDEVPKGYATAPIYVALGTKVFDASFGGVEHYGAKGGYSQFAGRDVSRALAKMSFDPADLENTSIDDLEEKHKKTLDDWIKTFEEKKGYPVVGRLEK